MTQETPHEIFSKHKDSDDPKIKAIIQEYAHAWLQLWEPGIQGKNDRFIKASKNLEKLGVTNEP